MPQDTPSRKLDQYIVRFPDGMRDQLKAMAEANGRSLNAEIVERLKETFQDAAGDREDYLAQKIDELRNTIIGLSNTVESALLSKSSESDDDLLEGIESLTKKSK